MKREKLEEYGEIIEAAIKKDCEVTNLELAQLIGVSERTLYRIFKDLNIKREYSQGNAIRRKEVGFGVREPLTLTEDKIGFWERFKLWFNFRRLNFKSMD